MMASRSQHPSSQSQQVAMQSAMGGMQHQHNNHQLISNRSTTPSMVQNPNSLLHENGLRTNIDNDVFVDGPSSNAGSGPSTAAVLDACILDLKARRYAMAQQAMAQAAALQPRGIGIDYDNIGPLLGANSGILGNAMSGQYGGQGSNNSILRHGLGGGIGGGRKERRRSSNSYQSAEQSLLEEEERLLRLRAQQARATGGMNSMSSMCGMGSMNGLGGMNGISGMNGLGGMNGMGGMNGLGGINGMGGMNGLGGMNGIGGMNGLGGINGMAGMGSTIGGSMQACNQNDRDAFLQQQGMTRPREDSFDHRPDPQNRAGGASTASSSQQWWVCRNCERRAFTSQPEALEHEAVCNEQPPSTSQQQTQTHQPSSQQQMHQEDVFMPSARQHVNNMSYMYDQYSPSPFNGQSRRDMMGDGRSQVYASMAGMQPMTSEEFERLQQRSRFNAMTEQRQLQSQTSQIQQSHNNNVNIHTTPSTPLQNHPVVNAPATNSTDGEVNLEDAQDLNCTNLAKPLPLAMPSDKDWITPLHCFVRRHCVEVFTATPDDVATPSKGKRRPILVGQVGIRCPHCHNPDTCKKETFAHHLGRERGSVYYPTTIASIYNATMNLLQRHLHSCASVPADIMQRYGELKADDARSGTSKKYWIDSAKSLGLVDTPHGICFSASPPPPLPRLSHQQVSAGMRSAARRNSNEFFSSNSNASPPPPDGGVTMTKIVTPRDQPVQNWDVTKTMQMPSNGTPPSTDPPLVSPEDEATATGFSFALLSQMQPCVFTEADRLGKRKGLPAGFAGLACRHCYGGYGSGRFFPSSIKTMSDTSKTLNVLYSHMMRCRKCPTGVREKLEKLKDSHDEERAKMKFGSQKAFFARIWQRLHGEKPPRGSAVAGHLAAHGVTVPTSGMKRKEDPSAFGGTHHMGADAQFGIFGGVSMGGQNQFQQQVHQTDNNGGQIPSMDQASVKRMRAGLVVETN